MSAVEAPRPVITRTADGWALTVPEAWVRPLGLAAAVTHLGTFAQAYAAALGGAR